MAYNYWTENMPFLPVPIQWKKMLLMGTRLSVRGISSAISNGMGVGVAESG